MQKNQMRTFSMWASPLALLISCGGSDGASGEDGAPLLTQSSDLSPGDACPAGGVEIEMGPDLDGDGELDDDEVTDSLELCNGEDGSDGSKGSNGSDGDSSLIRVSDVAPGSRCSAGGYLVQTGLDDGDGDETAGDGTLGDGEVDEESYACNGVDGFTVLTMMSAADTTNCPDGGQRLDMGLDNGDGGEDANDGTLGAGEIDSSSFLCNGATGPQGMMALVATSSEAAGSNCSAGGIRVDSGLDDDGDETLDGDEIDSTSYVCDGEGGSGGPGTLVQTTAEPAGANCAAGGVRVDSGVDDDESDTLEGGEIDSTLYVCNGEDGAASDSGYNALVSQTAINGEGTCAGAGIRVDSGVDSNENDVLDGGEITATEYLCEGSGSSGVVVTDDDGDVLGEVLSASLDGVFLRTSTGHLVSFSWDGEPFGLRRTEYSATGCTGNVNFSLGDSSPIHASAAFWSAAVGAFLVADSTEDNGLVFPASYPFVSRHDAAGAGCVEETGSLVSFPATAYTPAEIGLDFTIDAPLSLQ